MKILAEIHPKKKLEKLKAQLEDILNSFDGIDIPDSPMGEPSMMPVSIGSIARIVSKEEKDIIINQRLADVNELFVRSLSITARTFNLAIAFTHGDPPRFGRETGYLASEEAIKISKEYGVSSGLMLSFNKDIDEMKKRALKAKEANFFFLLRATTENVTKIGNEVIRKAIPYVIVKTEANSAFIKEISQPFVEERNLLEEIETYRRIGVNVVLISTLGNNESMKEVSNKLFH
ncbi:hypothetical protein [Sulfuracidifex tepidarius]|uniref:Methylenetetrahydrofolate reductase (NAD(P)H) n=1 Tax=Sulfuracidifex tepidarius TaxID=1294262 RepID=A0A510E3P4_9CREN|nr:hypothetical protein [Sulfuracidifex tepidarius]BBG24352.1 hypothetical protein IC006_1662 [Sulfuracidifex tepidarius]BBG27109.1 hypothetical protein IC007_1639 [Sulfuracidifex tepidarius]